MKRIILSILAFVFWAGTSSAGEPLEKKAVMHTPEQTAQLMIEKLEKDIVLSGQQKTVLMEKAVVLVRNRQVLKAKSDLVAEEQMLALKALEAAYEETLLNVLTPEQKEALTAKQEQRKEALQERLLREFSGKESK